jgi:hypothetical protein
MKVHRAGLGQHIPYQLQRRQQVDAAPYREAASFCPNPIGDL